MGGGYKDTCARRLPRPTVIFQNKESRLEMGWCRGGINVEKVTRNSAKKLLKISESGIRSEDFFNVFQTFCRWAKLDFYITNLYLHQRTYNISTFTEMLSEFIINKTHKTFGLNQRLVCISADTLELIAKLRIRHYRTVGDVTEGAPGV
jgi:hypothetical protein